MLEDEDVRGLDLNSTGNKYIQLHLVIQGNKLAWPPWEIFFHKLYINIYYGLCRSWYHIGLYYLYFDSYHSVYTHQSWNLDTWSWTAKVLTGLSSVPMLSSIVLFLGSQLWDNLPSSNLSTSTSIGKTCSFFVDSYSALATHFFLNLGNTSLCQSEPTESLPSPGHQTRACCLCIFALWVRTASLWGLHAIHFEMGSFWPVFYGKLLYISNAPVWR